MKTREEALTYGLTFEDAYQDAPFHDDNWQLVRYAPNKKAFLWSFELNGKPCINLKVSTDSKEIWRRAFESVLPAYHMSKEHWITVVLDGSIPDDDIKAMIAESYELISYNPTKRIYEAVRKIPKGHVATYAQIAEMAGNPRMCRAVGNALHKNPDPDNTPCFRVVNSKGELSGEFAFGGAGRQQALLEADGVKVERGKVDLEKYGIDVDFLMNI